MSPDASAESVGERRSLEPALLALGLAVAFSPALLDWLRHWSETPWARYSIVFPVLCALAARREPPGAAQPRSGTLCIAVGLAIELAAAFSGSIRWARPGLALAAFGWLRRGGLASGRSAALLAFAVPPPAFLMYPASAGLLALLVPPIAGALATPLCLPSELALGALAVGERGALAMGPLLAGIGWYESCLLARPPGRLLGACALWAVAGVGLVALEIVLWLLLVARGVEPAQAVAGLRWAWLPVSLLAVGWVEWRWRRTRRA